MSELAVAWPRGCHVFIDESKRRDYTLVAATVVPIELAVLRRGVNALRHKGSNSIHMRKEAPSTRKRILSGLQELSVSAHVVQCGDPGLRELDRRLKCLEHVLDNCAEFGAASLTIELDESLRAREQQFFVEACRARTFAAGFRYGWAARNDEPLLWISDVLAWSFVQGGDWRRRSSPMVRSVRHL